MFYTTWHNLQPDDKKEQKLVDKGYSGLTCCGISPYQKQKILQFIKSCNNKIYHTNEWFDDLDIKCLNNCLCFWFEKRKDKKNFEDLLKSFPKREYYIKISGDEKEIKKKFKKFEKNEDTMLYEFISYTFNGELQYCVSTSNSNMATEFKLIWG